jgi:hypothetical protein
MKDKYIFIIILIVLLIVWILHRENEKRKKREHLGPLAVGLIALAAGGAGAGLFAAFGGGNKSRIRNTMKNKTIYKSDLEAINSVTNSFVSSIVMANAADCFSSSSQYEETKIGDIVIAGKNQEANLSTITEQDSKLSLECLQKSIQEINISNQIATKLMQTLSETVDSSTMSKLVNESEQKNIQGLFANPFASSSASVNVDVSNIQENTTNRKLSNLVSNTVANKVDSKSIQQCFASNVQSVNTNIKELTMIGTNSKFELSVSTKQLAKTLANCKQLTEQTSKTTSALMSELDVRIVDDTKVTTKTDSEAKAVAISKTMGLDGVLASALSAAGLPSLISSICIMAICASLAGFMLMGGKPPSPEDLDKLKSGISGSSSPGKPSKK